MAIDDGEPAFPTERRLTVNGGIDEYGEPGMLLRDYFAAAAMQGLVVGCSGMLGNEFTPYAKGSCNAAIADRAYVLADVMLTRRVKDQP